MPPAWKGDLIHDMRKTGSIDLFRLFHRLESSFSLFVEILNIQRYYINYFRWCQPFSAICFNFSNVRTFQGYLIILMRTGLYASSHKNEFSVIVVSERTDSKMPVLFVFIKQPLFTRFLPCIRSHPPDPPKKCFRWIWNRCRSAEETFFRYPKMKIQCLFVYLPLWSALAKRNDQTGFLFQGRVNGNL